ncbi:MAG: hypothetical protein QM589_18295 [Thermomicrobiales bacterium]
MSWHCGTRTTGRTGIRRLYSSVALLILVAGWLTPGLVAAGQFATPVVETDSTEVAAAASITLTIDGDTGTILIPYNATFVVAATGLTPSAPLVFTVYPESDCTGTPEMVPDQIARADGTWAYRWNPAGSPARAFQVSQDDRTSNCVGVVIDEEQIVLTLDDHTGTVPVLADEDALFAASGLTPSTPLSFATYSKPACAGFPLPGGTDQIADANGFWTFAQMLPETTTAHSFRVFQGDRASNCVEFVFSSEPAPTAEWDPAIELTINNSYGPIVIHTHASVAVSARWLTDSDAFDIVQFGQSGCTGSILAAATFPAGSAQEVDWEGYLTFDKPAVHSAQVIQGDHLSNCVDITMSSIFFTINGSTNPVAIQPGQGFGLAISGLLPNQPVTYSPYLGHGCTGTPTDPSTETAGDDGTWAKDLTFGDPGEYSFQVTQGDTVSNCVDLTVSKDAPEPSPSVTVSVTPTLPPDGTTPAAAVTPTTVVTPTQAATATSVTPTVTPSGTPTSTAPTQMTTATPTGAADPSPTVSMAPSVTPKPSAAPSPTSVVSGLPNTGAGTPTGIPAPLWFLAGSSTMLLLAAALRRRHLRR